MKLSKSVMFGAAACLLSTSARLRRQETCSRCRNTTIRSRPARSAALGGRVHVARRRPVVDEHQSGRVGHVHELRFRDQPIADMEQHAKHLSGHEKRLLENALHTGQSGHGVQPVPGQRNADELHARRRLLETSRLQHDFGRLRTGDRQIDHGRAGRIHERRPPLVAGPPRQRSLPAFPTRGRRPVGRHSGIPDGDTRPDERRAGQ